MNIIKNIGHAAWIIAGMLLAGWVWHFISLGDSSGITGGGLV